MGNYTSSCLHFSHPSSKTAKLVDSQGNLRQVKVLVRAGELMLEEPGHVIAPAYELQRTRRVVAMRAEDELVAGKLYLSVSFSRVNCKVSAKEIGIIESYLGAKSNKKMLGKKRRGGAKVIPELMEEGENRVEVLEVGDNVSSSTLRKGNHRPWTPVLETISEEF